MKILSSFTHPHVVPNLYEFLSYVEHKFKFKFKLSFIVLYFILLFIILLFIKENVLKNAGNQTVHDPHWLPYISVHKSMGTKNCLVLQNSSKYLLLWSTLDRNLYSFGTTWGWVNDDKMFILGRTILLRSVLWHPSLEHAPLSCQSESCDLLEWNRLVFWFIIFYEWMN